jgi:LytR cell envelope-related transcriptional attenuator
MSMLTPTGMRGRKNRITGRRYPRMRPRPRRRRTIIAALGAVTMVGLLSFGTLQLVGVFTADEEEPGTGPANAGASRPDAADCAPPGDDPDQQELPATLPEAGAITVNVLNATTRSGLAQETATALEQRGFEIGTIANAPAGLDGTVTQAGLLRGTEQAEASGALAVVGTQLDGAETGEPKAEGERGEVDLVIGDGFTELLTPRESERRLADLTDAAAAGNDPGQSPSC